MITAKLSGGIGNQLYQIAGALAASWDRKDIAVFDRQDYTQLTQGTLDDRYFDTIYRNLNWGEIDRCKFMDIGGKLSDGDILPDCENIRLVHYTHDLSYFAKYLDPIRAILDLDPATKNELMRRYDPTQCCSIHVRRGDYLLFPHYHSTIGIDYYARAISIFPSTKFLIFSDDINWCRQRFGGNVEFVEDNPDYIDLYLMSLCHSNIVANSTFSEWGSYLNSTPNKQLIKPYY